MHVLFVTMQYGRGYSQGTERYLSILADGLTQRGHQVTFLAGDPQGQTAASQLGEPRAAVRAGELHQQPLVATAGSGGAPAVLHYPSAGWMALQGVSPARIRRLLQRLAPDIVHLANPGHIGVGVIDAARALGIPMVVTVVDFWWLCPKHTLWRAPGEVCTGEVSMGVCLRCMAHDRPHSRRRTLARGSGGAALPLLYAGRWLTRGVSPAEVWRWRDRRGYLLRALDQASRVILLSDTAADLLRPRLRTAPCVRITNGLEPDWFEPADPAPALGASPGERVIGYAGAVLPHKGVHVLVEAVSRLSDARIRLRIAGSGSDEYIRSLQSAAGGAVKFVGALRPDQMKAFLHSLDLLVVPSLWLENIPMIVLEGAACGTPVLASDVGGIAELMPKRHAADADRPDAARRLPSVFERGSVAALTERLRDWLDGGVFEPLPRPRRAEEMVSDTVAVYESCLRRG